MNLLHLGRRGRFVTRLGAALCVCSLLCVPALTRITQKLEPESHTPSFSKNIDCPPKKVTVAPVVAIASPIPLDGFDTILPVRLALLLDLIPPPSPTGSAPRPLRAPPSALFV
jgi:hypothetical protein